jgi:hypothetical protein
MKNHFEHMLPDGRIVTRNSDRQYTHIVISRTKHVAGEPWCCVGWSQSETNATKRLNQHRRYNPKSFIEGRVEQINGGSRVVGHMDLLTGEIVRDLPKHS